MSEIVKKGSKGVLLKATLLFSSVDGMVASALMVPIIGNVAMSFPGESPVLLNQLVSLPSLLMIPAILITGYVSRYISKKYLLMFGSIIFIAAGFGSMYSPTLQVLVIFRAIEGVGMGIVYPLAPSIIAHLFYGEERAKMFGWSNAVGGVFSFVLGIAAGAAALTNWRNAFYYYLIFVIVVIMQALLLPAFPPERKDKEIAQSAYGTADKPKYNYAFCLAVGAMFMFMAIGIILIYNISIFILNEGIGNSAQVGLGTSLNTAASFFLCIFFGYILKSLKRYTSVLSLIFLALCYFTLASAHSIGWYYLGMSFMGCSFGLMFPYLNWRTAAVAPKAVKTVAISWLSMAIYSGQWASGYISVWITNIVGGTTRKLFTAVSVILIASAVISAIFIVLTMKNESKVVIGDTDVNITV